MQQAFVDVGVVRAIGRFLDLHAGIIRNDSDSVLHHVLEAIEQLVSLIIGRAAWMFADHPGSAVLLGELHPEFQSTLLERGRQKHMDKSAKP